MEKLPVVFVAKEDNGIQWTASRVREIPQRLEKPSPAPWSYTAHRTSADKTEPSGSRVSVARSRLQ
jgi:hypothetical protein